MTNLRETWLVGASSMVLLFLLSFAGCISDSDPLSEEPTPAVGEQVECTSDFDSVEFGACDDSARQVVTLEHCLAPEVTIHIPAALSQLPAAWSPAGFLPGTSALEVVSFHCAVWGTASNTIGPASVAFVGELVETPDDMASQDGALGVAMYVLAVYADDAHLVRLLDEKGLPSIAAEFTIGGSTSPYAFGFAGDDEAQLDATVVGDDPSGAYTIVWNFYHGSGADAVHVVLAGGVSLSNPSPTVVQTSGGAFAKALPGGAGISLSSMGHLEAGALE